MKSVFSIGLAALSFKMTIAEEAIHCEAGSTCAQALESGILNGFPTGNSLRNQGDGQFQRCGKKNNSFCLKNRITNVLPLDTFGDALLQANQPANIASENGEDEVAPRFGLKVNIPVINNYGCWCYGGEYWPGARDWTGFGPFMDEYDDACKAHHMGFDCITMDADAEGETCIPNETTYTLKVTPQNNGDYTLECADEIEDKWCERRTCLVDLRFIARHWHLEDLGIEPDYAQFGHNGFHNNVGDFDVNGNCLLPKHNGPGGHQARIVKVCCGDYPYRIWFDKRNNRGISCCEYEDASISADYGFALKVGQLYNNMAATCCADGVRSDGNVC